MLVTTPTQAIDATIIEPHLQEYSRAELLAYVEPGHETALIEQFIDEAIEAYTVWYYEIPILIFGYTTPSLVAGYVCPWGVWSKDVWLYVVKSARSSRAFYDNLINTYGAVRNMCREDNPRIHRWQKIMGCTVYPEVVGYSSRGVALLEYERRA